ncbi:hypothetical protein SteCoe_19460 [Stentor coeruleus]|uniref:Importin N-terminal domain-containing protein n=1 Tax=Stentor coeruleus TaxID=5963 RepID=A0A1R2BUH7_9CILI|nr:hypothetical protein SteCoe_19460 [Stentor coeruleus]
MNELDLASLETECEKFVRNPSAAPSVQLVNFFESQENFNMIYCAIFQSRHTSLLYLCLNSFLKILPVEWKKLTLEQRSHIHSSLLSMLISETSHPNYLLSILSKSLARVCRLSLIEFSNTKATITFLLQSISQSSQNLSISLKFFEELIIEIHEPLKSKSKFINRKILIKFRDSILTEILSYTTNAISSLQHIDHIKSFLNIFILCLNYDILNTTNDESADDPICLHIPSQWKSILIKQELLESLEKILIESIGEIELLGIRVLSQLGAIRKSVFTCLEEREFFMRRYLEIVMKIMKFKVLCDDNLYEFLKAVKRFLCNFGVKDISTIGDFGAFLESLAQYTLVLTSQKILTLEKTLNTLCIWTFLASDSAGPFPKVKDYIPGLFQYIIGRTLESVTNDIFTEEKENDLEEFLQQTGTFSINFYPEIHEILTKFIIDESQNIQTGTINDLQLSWLILISSSILATQNKKSGISLNDKIVDLITKLIVKLTNSSYYIELSIIVFYDAFFTAYLSSTFDNYWEDSSSIIGEFSLGQLSYSILEVLFRNLTKYQYGKILEKSLLLFSKLSIGSYSTKIITSLPQVFSLINYPQCSFTDNKLRSRFFTALTQLWSNDENSLGEFYQCLIDKMQKYSEKTENVKIIFIELHGICKALTTEKAYNEFFNTVYEGLWGLIRDINSLITDPEVFHCLLKFLKEFTDNRNDRIKFDISEAYGVVIFKYISQILIFYCKKHTANSQIDENIINNKAKFVLNVVNNMLYGRYISFGVFEIYNDDTFVNMITICFNIISKCKDIYTYNKIMSLVYRFIESLCKNHGRILFCYLHNCWFEAMLSFLVFGIKSDCIRYLAVKYAVDANNAISCFCDYIVKTIRLRNRESEIVKKRLESEDQKMDEIYEALFEVIFTQEVSYLWTFSKVLLGLAVINQKKFEQIKNCAIEKLSLPEETKSKIQIAASKLLEGVKQSLDAQNKDIFLKNFNKFKQVLSSIN